MKLPIVRYGDPILRTKGKRIAAVDAHIRELAANMIETMHLANGIGLAAQQVGEALQLTVVDVSGAEDQESTLKLNGAEVDPKSSMPLLLLNPELTLNKETSLAIEGCLSFPEITADIRRAISVVVRAQTLEGAPVEIEASGLLARALQHEVDHLNGILFIDRMSAATKVALRSRLKRMQKENAPRENSGLRVVRRVPLGAAAALNLLISHRDIAVNVGLFLRREVEKLEGRFPDHPLITDQRLNDVRVVVARTRNQTPSSILGVKVTADFPHPIVVMFQRPIRILVLQFNLRERAALEGKECPLQSRMDQSLNR